MARDRTALHSGRVASWHNRPPTAEPAGRRLLAAHSARSEAAPRASRSRAADGIDDGNEDPTRHPTHYMTYNENGR
jgi:hypothetical protein